MKRALKVLGAIVVASVVAAVLLYPVVLALAKRKIVAELAQFVRAGSVRVEDVSIALKRREVRFRNVSVLDASGATVVRLPKIDLRVRRMHLSHIDATMKIFEPDFEIDFDRSDTLARLVRWEAFQEEGVVTVDRLEVTGATLRVRGSSILPSAETLTAEIKADLESDTEWVVMRAAGPQTSVHLALRAARQGDERVFLEGTGLVIKTTNVLPAPAVETAPGSTGLSITVVPADSIIPAFSNICADVKFSWGPLVGTFSRLRQMPDSSGVFGMDRIQFQLGPETIECESAVVDVWTEQLRLFAERMIRNRTGLVMEDVAISASGASSTFCAAIHGRKISASAEWGKISRVRFKTDSLPIAVVLREVDETYPVGGVIAIDADVTRYDTAPEKLYWKTELTSSDFRVGPEFGKISLRLNIGMRGVSEAVEDVRGVVELSPGLPVYVSGKGTAGRFSGKWVMKDRPIADIQMLGEMFGHEFPMKAESGVAGFDVDFSTNRRLQWRLRGRVRVQDAVLASVGFPFRVEGLNVDFPFEQTPDTGKLVVEEAAIGRVRASSLSLGPYTFDGFSMSTASKGDKIFAKLDPISAFGGSLQGQLLFYISESQRHEADIKIEGVSLARILRPFRDARESISGRLRGEIKVNFLGASAKSARGSVWFRAEESADEPMRVSREFLEQIGGKMVRKLGLPKSVPYRDGSLKVRLSEGRIWFDEVDLEAHTLLRKVRIGKVVGSYLIKDLVDVVTHVSADSVKVEFGGKKKK